MPQNSPPTTTASERAAGAALVLFCAATVLLIPLERFVIGGVCWVAGAAALLRATPVTRRRLGTLFGAIALLAASPIHTDRSTLHILQLGACFALVVFGPGLLLRHDGDVIEWRLWPRRFQWPDLFYVLISIPLAWFVLRVYFFVINPELPTHWPMPTVPDADSRWRLFLGINAVGIWDELFFVNVVFGVLRSLYRPPLANLAQAVVYTSVLYDMAFTGVGPLIIYGFALTQGAMYERERCLLYVLIVHLIVDAFLVAAILQYHYPGMGLHCF